MHRFESGKREGIREEITNLQRSGREEVFQNLQRTLGDSRKKDNPKRLILNLSRELRDAGIAEKGFADFLEKEAESELTLMLGQIKKEWVGALDNAEDLDRVRGARDGIKKKAGILESMAKKCREILAVAYCLRDSSGKSAGEVFSKMSESEAGILFRRAEKEAEEHIERLTKGEVSEVFRKIAFGV